MDIKIHQYCVDPRSVWRYGWIATNNGKVVEIKSGFISKVAAKQSAKEFVAEQSPNYLKGDGYENKVFQIGS